MTLPPTPTSWNDIAPWIEEIRDYECSNVKLEWHKREVMRRLQFFDLEITHNDIIGFAECLNQLKRNNQ